MVLVERQGIPVGLTITAASPAEVRLAEPTLNSRVLPHRRLPRWLIADLAYDSDPLRARLAARHVTLISPHRINRIRPSQDGRQLRRYRVRWIVERTIAWYGAFRRLVVRYERSTHMYLAFFQLASALIALRRL
jgi:transposase